MNFNQNLKVKAIQEKKEPINNEGCGKSWISRNNRSDIKLNEHFLCYRRGRKGMATCILHFSGNITGSCMFSWGQHGIRATSHHYELQSGKSAQAELWKLKGQVLSAQGLSAAWRLLRYMLSHDVPGLPCWILNSSHSTDNFWHWKLPLPELSIAKQGPCLELKQLCTTRSAPRPGSPSGDEAPCFFGTTPEGITGTDHVDSQLYSPHVGTAFVKHHNNLCSAGLWEAHSKVLLLFLFQQQIRASSIFPEPMCHHDASR